MGRYKYKLKFHLGKGKNYQKWQLRSENTVDYYDPNLVNLVLFDCYLSNQINAAKKIHAGGNRQPIAYIWFNNFEISQNLEHLNLDQPIYYNPKIVPYWRSHQGNNIDKTYYQHIITVNRTPYIQDSLITELPITNSKQLNLF